MKSSVYLWGLTMLSTVLLLVLIWKVFSLENQLRSLGTSDSAALQDTLKRVQADLALAKDLAPGLGESMTRIQLHAGKLWFAAQASNWDLAAHQLHELEESMEAVTKLNAEENGIKISAVMDAVLKTQIAQLEAAIKAKNQSDFQKSYDETLSACNGCHTETGHRFIRITRPAAPPITNQKWEMSAN